jgi:predicted amidohydrolase
MKVGFFQFAPIFGNPEKNLKVIRESVTKADSPDILVLPELALTGYTFEDSEEAYSLSEEVGGKLTGELISIAGENRLTMAVGFLEREGKHLYNSSILICGEGVVGVYRKVHLFREEKAIFKSGNMGFPVFPVGNINIGLLVCFDWIFPEAMRTLALKGADIILHSANLVLTYYQKVAITRAIENRVFIVLANRTGIEERFGSKNEFTGESEIVDPKGRIMLKAGKDEEGIFSIDINPEEARDKKITDLNDIFEDRKPEFYENWG